MDPFVAAEDAIMVAQVPIAGVRTIYSRVGDSFGWLCVVALTALALRSLLAT